MTHYEKNTKKSERSWSRLLEAPHPFGNGMNNVQFFGVALQKLQACHVLWIMAFKFLTHDKQLTLKNMNKIGLRRKTHYLI
jgi:hypothetical protein